jgi:hypothetical protein
MHVLVMVDFDSCLQRKVNGEIIACGWNALLMVDSDSCLQRAVKGVCD